jgi:lysozyme family protein
MTEPNTEPRTDANFLLVVKKVIDHEGGDVNDPQDPGGETKYGISRRSYPSLNIRELTLEKALAIYWRDWWIAFRYAAIKPYPIAAKVFDLAVNIGPAKAHKFLQEAVNTTSPQIIKIDAVLGPITLNTINGHANIGFLLAEFKLAAVEYYLVLDKPKDLSGWIRRALD